MKVSLNWLKELIDLDVSPEKLAEDMTMLGLEIEAIERPGAETSNVYIGKILTIDPHPDADRLVVCRTDIGSDQPLQIVCGATNMKAGDKVPTAIVGATLPGGFQIAKRKVRGIESYGMMCSARELGLGEDHAGLLILPEDAPTGASAGPYLGLDDTIFDIEITPNRGDWASMLGIARELAALYGKTVHFPQIKLIESGEEAAHLSSVHIEEPELCHRYAGRVLLDVKVGPSPLWLTRRLSAAGQRSINNIVDITNLILLETGHPLHAFDYDKLLENRIVARRAKRDETIETLDEQARKLDSTMLVIADASNPVAIAGIMGGKKSEVRENTTRIFLESAWFEPRSIRKTARALGMMTESSQRFQRGADKEMVHFAINRAASLMQQIANAQVAKGILDEYPRPHTPATVELRYHRTARLLGSEIESATQRKYLKSLGFRITSEQEGSCVAEAPSWRHDVSHEADLIEEIARLHSYDKVGETLPRIPRMSFILAPQEKRLRELRRCLVGMGLTEIVGITFSSPQAVRLIGLPSDYENMTLLQNPLSENYAGMRTSLLPGALGAVAENIRRGVSDIRIFELGPVYNPRENQELPEHEQHLAIILTGLRAPRAWNSNAMPCDFYDLKGYAEELCGRFGATPSFALSDFPVFETGHAASLRLDQNIIGHCGEVRAAVLRRLDINHQAVFALEITLEPLISAVPPPKPFRPIPSFPPVLRDLAVWVNRATPAGELQRTAQNAGGLLLRQADIIDVYTGEKAPPGKKSIALSLVFQSTDRTLNDTEVQKVFEAILNRLQEEHQAELR